MQKLRSSKLLKYYNKKGQIIDASYCFLLHIIYSILVWVFETNQTAFSRFDLISGCSNALQYFNIFQKVFTLLKILFVPRQCFLFFYLAPKKFSWAKPIIPVVQNGWNSKVLTLKLSAALLYRSGGVRNYFLYKAPVYLRIEHIKPFAGPESPDILPID